MQSIIKVARLGSSQGLEPGEVGAGDLAALAQGIDLEHIGVTPAWAMWAVDQLPANKEGIEISVRLLSHKQCVAFAIKCAEPMLGIFERDCLGDRRPRKAIGAARQWLSLGQGKSASGTAYASATTIAALATARAAARAADTAADATSAYVATGAARVASAVARAAAGAAYAAAAARAAAAASVEAAVRAA